MFAVRYVALAALVIWLGGMVVLGLVAPSVFRVLQVSDPATGRVLAGAVFGEMLRVFHLIAYGCGVVILIALVVMKLVGPPPRGFVVRIAVVAAMLGLALYSGVPLAGEIARMQAQVSGPIHALPDSDRRRVRFNRLHATSTSLMTANTVLGLALLCWYVRE